MIPAKLKNHTKYGLLLGLLIIAVGPDAIYARDRIYLNSRISGDQIVENRLLSEVPGQLSNSDIVIDNKITPAEEKKYQAAVKQADKYAPSQANAINKIPNVQVKTQDLQEEAVKTKPGLNPIAWLFKPITRLQEQSVRLEQQIMKLTGPIAALQPGMLRLEERMTGVQKQTHSVQDQIGRMQTQLSTVQAQMSGIQEDIGTMRTDLGALKQPIIGLREPITELREPLLSIQKPITGVDQRLKMLDQQLNNLKTLLGLILASVFVAAAVVAFGTPIAAILIWRNRSKLLPPPSAHESKEEAMINRGGQTLAKQLHS